jgi:hypothetical protein
MYYWHITKATYHPDINQVSEKRVSNHSSFEDAKEHFIKLSDAKEPVYLWFAQGEQVETLYRSKAFDEEVRKEKD